MGDQDTLGGFPRELFQERRDRALEALGQGAMVLPAASPLLRTGDSELPYRPDSELFYLTGFTEPGALLVLRGFADEDRSVLFVQPRSPKEERWTGPRLGPQGAKERVGVDRARSVDELAGGLPELLDGADRIHFRLGAHPAVEPLVVQALRKARARGARKGTGPRGVVDPGEILDDLRLLKSPEEIQALREAARVTALGVRRGLEAAGPGTGEWEIQAVVEATFRREGAQGPAFATIVGSGPNACVLHYVANSRKTREGDLVLVDAGAEVRMYAGDMSRTFPVSGRFSPEQRALYEVVEAARARGVAAVAPGSPVARVHDAAVRALVEGLVELGVLEGDPEELQEGKAYRPFFPHQTSHWLGLNAHDPGDYARAGDARTLEPGMVVTVEPGLYLAHDWALEEEAGPDDPDEEGSPPPVVEAALAPFLGMGIRIEDTVLVTPEGPEVLTTGVPSDPEALEQMLRD